VPIKSILAIYASENGQGMVFESDEVFDDEDSDDEATSMSSYDSLKQTSRPTKPKLTIIK
jgi:stringent starvation protein B